MFLPIPSNIKIQTPSTHMQLIYAKQHPTFVAPSKFAGLQTSFGHTRRNLCVRRQKAGCIATSRQISWPTRTPPPPPGGVPWLCGHFLKVINPSPRYQKPHRAFAIPAAPALLHCPQPLACPCCNRGSHPTSPLQYRSPAPCAHIAWLG